MNTAERSQLGLRTEVRADTAVDPPGSPNPASAAVTAATFAERTLERITLATAVLALAGWTLRVADWAPASLVSAVQFLLLLAISASVLSEAARGARMLRRGDDWRWTRMAAIPLLAVVALALASGLQERLDDGGDVPFVLGYAASIGLPLLACALVTDAATLYRSRGRWEGIAAIGLAGAGFLLIGFGNLAMCYAALPVLAAAALCLARLGRTNRKADESATPRESPKVRVGEAT